METLVYYEQPLNERIRTFLRLEMLFAQAQYHLKGGSIWASRAALGSLLEILGVFGRSDLKSEVLKELERHGSTLARLERNPDIDTQRLHQVLDEINSLSEQLHTSSGQVGQELKQSEFLNSIRQRNAIPGGTCDFDLPAYHYWLEQPAETRIRDLKNWLSTFNTIQNAIQLILRLTRDSATPSDEQAHNGFYQRSLDPAIPCQLVRVALPTGSPYFAEISGGKHRFTVRFLIQPDPAVRATHTESDVKFRLSCCII